MAPSHNEIARITSFLDIETVPPDHADLAFVFGTRHPTPAHIAADLYRRGVTPYIVLTGGPNRDTGVIEAATHLEVLLHGSILREHVIVEDESTTTLENVLFALPRIKARLDVRSVRAIVAVAKWYHCRRALMTLKRHFPQGIRYFACTYEPSDTTRAGWHLSPASRKRILKEWQCIPQYRERGDIAEIQKVAGAFV